MKRDLFEPALDMRADARADERAAVRVDRAQLELRHGRAVALTGDDPARPVLLAAALDGLDASRLPGLLHWSARWRLLLTAERLWAMGMGSAAAAQSFAIEAGPDAAALHRLALALEGGERVGGVQLGLPPADPAPDAARASGQREGPALRDARPASPAMQAALALAKRARLMPALLVCELPCESLPLLQSEEVLCLPSSEVAAALAQHGSTLRQVSEARVPLAGHADCRVLLYREAEGGAEHVAVIVGRPEMGEAVAVRLHSACLTGDLLGSLRCDCGEQLRGAVKQLVESGGVLLYLAQEGRGIGLANKLRAYRLQDGGLDTFEADRHLGFAADQRDFAPAAAMLRSLGIARVRLLSNNPRKIDALCRAGIEVVERLPLTAPRNPHNARYIEAKQEQAGHYA